MDEPFDMVDQTDACFKKSVVYSKVIAKSKGIKLITPEILMLAVLTSGPNIVTGVFSFMNIRIATIVDKLADIVNKYTSSDFYGLSEIKYDDEMGEIIRQAFDCANEMKDSVVSCHHLVIVALRLNKNINSVFSSAGFNFNTFRNALRENVMPQHETPYNFFDGEEEFPDPTRKVTKPPNTKIGQRRTAARKQSQDILSQFCSNLTESAKQGKLDPVVGREKEIERVITILRRKKKNNPLLVGFAGVGKTAIVEGVAQMIADKKVSTSLIDKKIYAINVSMIVAGTQYRGQFEERMNRILKVFKENPNNILFVDEMHTLLGAGGASGTLDASNIMKPALARGELRCIGATTDEEYKKYLSKDRAFERRFQRVVVNEPSLEQTIEILIGLREVFEKHHGCRIDDAALVTATKLSGRYVNDRHFPDKAIDVIDEACAKYVKVGIEQLPIMPENVIQVVADQSGVPIEIVSCSEIERALLAKKNMKQRVVGQEKAIEVLFNAIQNAYCGIQDPNRPLGIFLFGGPSGVGKTYVVEELAENLLSNKEALIRINLNEFSEKHQQSKLLGSPPGYVGYGEQNQFGDRILKNPYSLVLLDEIEKAHPSVLKMFLQVFSTGIMVDALGRTLNFRQCFFVLTTNLGQNVNKAVRLGFGDSKDAFNNEMERKRLVGLCKESFGPEFVNRMDEVVLFRAFTDKEQIKLADHLLLDMSERIERNTNGRIVVKHSIDVSEKIKKLSQKEIGYNANRIKRVIVSHVERVISEAIVKNIQDPFTLTLYVNKQGEIVCRRTKRCK